MKKDTAKQSTENFVKDIRRKTRRLFTSEQKILIVMEAIRGEQSVAEICRQHDIHQTQFYKWNKEFLEAGKKRLSGDTTEKLPLMKWLTCVKKMENSKRW
jgi:transposase